MKTRAPKPIAIQCPRCGTMLQEPPGRVCCSRCELPFDVRRRAAIEGEAPYRDTDQAWEAVVGMAPPAGVVDLSGGSLIRCVRVFGRTTSRFETVHIGLSVVWFTLAVASFAGILFGPPGSALAGYVLVGFGLFQLAQLWRRRMMSERISIERGVLRRERADPFRGAGERTEVLLEAITGLQVDGSRGVLVNTADGDRLLLADRLGREPATFDWLVRHLDHGLDLARQLRPGPRDRLLDSGSDGGPGHPEGR